MRFRFSYFLTLSGLCLCIVACSSNPARITQDDLRHADCPNLRWEPVAPDLWVLHGHERNSNPANAGRISNILFARENTGASPRGWLVNSGPSQRMGQLLRCSLEHQLGAVVTDLVSTRAHPESVLGASAFMQARHWALPQVALAMQQRCPHCSQNLAATVEDTVIANQSIAIPLQHLNATPLSITATHTASSHGPFLIWSVEINAQEWTTLIQHLASGAWFAPGLVWGAHLVPDARDADVYRLIAALQALEKQHPLQVIPEQGRTVGLQLVQANMDYWTQLATQTARAIRSGASDASALQEPSSFNFWPADSSRSAAHQELNRNRHSLNQQRVWQQLEQIYFDAPDN
jgi:hypothetical protein